MCTEKGGANEKIRNGGKSVAAEWILFAVFAVLSIVHLTGHGAFLIAGYNTAGKKRQAQYNKKKLCRVMGVGMAVITMLLLVQNLLGDHSPGWFGIFSMVIVLADIIVMLYIMNRKCLVSDGDVMQTTEDHRARKWSIGLTAVILLIVVALLVTGDIHMEYGEDSFTIKATYWKNKTIAYDEMEQIEYRTEDKAGSRVGGFGSMRLQLGNFENNEFGKYTRYSYVAGDACIVLTVNGETVVIGGKNDEDTRMIYEELLKREQ